MNDLHEELRRLEAVNKQLLEALEGSIAHFNIAQARAAIKAAKGEV